ncbi:lipopolysaccharide biosynthesis protein [Anaerorhabdus sp.]|uniref:lipopolysaccharide biosynthesis protein n=1 Tax=Anaerorhabdus sp. TaxID=1872524 RepID=UPI002FCC9B60
MFSSNTKQKYIGILIQSISFFLNALISFVISPLIITKLGEEVYGFVGLATNFVSYIQVFVVGVNTMINRLIIIYLHKEGFKEVSQYLSTVIFYNILLSIIFIPIIIWGVLNITSFLNIPINSLTDIQILWGFLLLCFIIDTIMQPFSTAVIAKNKFELNTICEMVGNILKVSIIMFSLYYIGVNVWIIGFGSFIYSIYYNWSMKHYMKKFYPYVKIALANIKLKVLKEGFLSGIWITTTKISQIFTSGLDLLLANLFLNDLSMGILAVAKIIPSFISNFFISISFLFNPEIYEMYAKSMFEEMAITLKESMRFLIMISTIPCALLIGFGSNFYNMWLPDQNSNLLYILSILILFNSCFTGPLQPIYQLYTVAGKVKLNSIIMLIYGVLSLFLTYIFLKYFNGGLYAISGVSLVLSLLFSLLFHAPFGAKIIKKEWWYFYGLLFKSFMLLILSSIICSIINILINPHTYLQLFTGFTISGFLCLVIEMLLLFRKEEMVSIAIIIKNKMKGLRKS